MPRRRLLRRACLLAPALVLVSAGCAPRDGRAPRPDLAFETLPPMGFDVAEVVTELAYVPPGKAPFVDHRFALPPSRAAAIWARERLAARGETRRMVFEVNEASVVESLVDGEGGSGLLSMTRQILRYDARMVINVHVFEDNGFLSATAKVTAERSVTVPESAEPIERDAAWNMLLQDLMADVDVQLEATLLEVFEEYRAI